MRFTLKSDETNQNGTQHFQSAFFQGEQDSTSREGFTEMGRTDQIVPVESVITEYTCAHAGAIILHITKGRADEQGHVADLTVY